MKKFTAIILVIMTLLGVGNSITGIVNNRLIHKMIDEEITISETEKVKNSEIETTAAHTVFESVTTAEETTTLSFVIPGAERNRQITDEVNSLPALERSDDGRLVYNSETEVYYLISDRKNIIVDEFYAKTSDSVEDYTVKEDYIFFMKNGVLYVWNMSWLITSDVYSEEYATYWPISNEFMNEIIANTKM